jgi:hypothetical protein
VSFTVGTKAPPMTVKAGNAPSIAFPIEPKHKGPDSDSISEITSPNDQEHQLSKKEKID